MQCLISKMPCITIKGEVETKTNISPFLKIRAREFPLEGVIGLLWFDMTCSHRGLIAWQSCLSGMDNVGSRAGKGGGSDAS